MKKLADKKRIEVYYDIGDWVFVKLQPYRQHSVSLTRNQKLTMKILWTFLDFGNIAYKLLLPDNAKIQLIFHVSML